MDIDKILRQEELKLAAKDYISKGLSIIPVGANKIPLISWMEFCDRIAKPEEVDAWFEKFPDAQLGMVTGFVSGITVVDVEAEGGETEWNKLPQDCPIVKTGSGGRHYWFLYERNLKNAVRIDGQIKHCDIRNDHGYVILPPSISEKGSYEWIKQVPPVHFPKHLFKAKSEKQGYVESQIKNPKKGVELMMDLYLGAGEGSRNDSMAKYTGYILTQIHPADWETKAWPLTMEANKKNTPPLPMGELRKTYESICQAEKAKNPDRFQKEEIENKIKEADRLPIKKDYKNRYTWGTRGLDMAFAIIKRGNFIVLGAKSGCLHPDTPIFDPINKTTLTVKERYVLGKSFNVFSLNEKKEVIITRAEAPAEFAKTEMVELSNGKNTIVVTPNHRVWDGEKYTKVCDLLKSSSVLLPSISDTFLSKCFSDDQNSSDKVSGFQFCYHSLFRLCGRLLRWTKDTFLNVSPSQVGVLEHSQHYSCVDGQVPLIRCNRLYQLFCHPSIGDCLSRKNIPSESLVRPRLYTFLLLSLTRPLSFLFRLLFCLTYKALRIGLFVPLSKVYNVFQNSLHDCTYDNKINNKSFKYSKWELRPQVDEVYYDFTVPKYENYYACGLFHHNSGKTTWAFDMAQKNALLGHKVLFLSLEMDEKEVKESVARRSAGITIEEEYDYTIPESKQKYFNDKILEINSIKNLFFRGVRRGGGLKWEEILEIVYSFDDLDLIFIDNLDLIEGDKGEQDLERQKRIVKKIMGFTSEKQIPIVLIHHYRKTMGKDANANASVDDLSGSMKIVDGADRIVNIKRNKDPNAPYPEKYLSRIYLQKGREYPDAIKDVFFIQGTFVDESPAYEEIDPLAGKSPLQYLEEEKLREELEKEHQEAAAQSAIFGDKD